MAVNEEKYRIADKIYQEIFSNIESQNIIVFLCGGASKKDKKSIRDRVRASIEQDKKRYYRSKPLKIFYPEDLLVEILNQTKDADLLSYERFLANNSDVIAIICESPGALVELGAFTNNDHTVDKVIAAVEKKKVKDKSFIMLGPIKYLKQKNKYSFIEYDNDTEKFAGELSRRIREKVRNEYNDKLDVDTIVGLHYYIQVLLYFYKKLGYNDLTDLTGRVVGKGNAYKRELYSAALKLLFKDKQITKVTVDGKSHYELTLDGYVRIEVLISGCTKRGDRDKIRIELMKEMLYDSSRF